MRKKIYPSIEVVVLTAIIFALFALPAVVRAGSLVSWGYDGHGQVSNTLVIAGSSGISPPPFWEDCFWGMTSSIERAFPFTVASGGPYIVEELEVAAYHYEGMAGSTAYFSINNDNNGEPGDVLATIEMTGITTTQQ